MSTRHGIEILEETNSKALLVFTTVTLIFLPLSFVSSVFGMNTRDIRDLDRGQWVFWASAIPLTLLVIIVSIIVAYNGVNLKYGVAGMFASARAAMARLSPKNIRLPVWNVKKTQKTGKSVSMQDDGPGPGNEKVGPGRLNRQETLRPNQFRVKNVQTQRSFGGTYSRRGTGMSG